MPKLNKLLILFFFTFFALALTAPLASSHYVPSGDFLDHAKAIVLAKNALAEHQFPIRIAPDLTDGPRYPLFQFYSPLPYFLSALIYKFILVHNPYIAYKLITWLALILGGLYSYRIAKLLVKDKKVALLAGVAYQLSPYWIINTTIRTDFTESVAQGLLPVALYYSLCVFQQRDLKHFVTAAIAWALLAMTHLVTFAYGMAFFLILVGIIAWREKKSRGNFLRILMMVAFSYLLAAWFIGPILLVHSQLNLQAGDPIQYNMFTPLLNLISLQSISPLPLPARGELNIDYLYPALGYPILLGIGILIYAFFKDRSFYQKNPLITPLLITFSLALFATWSPIDFWRYLPRALVIAQFSYRFLTQVMWLGMMLFAYAVYWLFSREPEERRDTIFILLVCVIVIGNSFWLHSQKNNDISTSEIIHGYQAHLATDYRISLKKVAPKDLLMNSELLNTCKQQRQHMICQLQVMDQPKTIALPMLWYPQLLRVKINNKTSAYYPTINEYPANSQKVMVGLTLNPGTYTIDATFRGLWWANWLCLFAWISALILLVKALLEKRKQRQ